MGLIDFYIFIYYCNSQTLNFNKQPSKMNEEITPLGRRVLKALQESTSPFTVIKTCKDNVILIASKSPPSSRYLIKPFGGNLSKEEFKVMYTTGIIPVFNLTNKYASYDIFAKIERAIRAHNRHAEQKVVRTDKRVDFMQKDKVLPITLVIERLKRLVRNNSPSPFEEKFFNTTSRKYYLTYSAKELAEFTTGNIFQREFQQRIYGWDPAKPSTSISQQLYTTIQQLVHPDDAGGLEFYCLLASEADWRDPKADLAIKFKGRSEIVWVDLTSHAQKQSRDPVLLLRPWDFVDLKTFADRVVDILCG